MYGATDNYYTYDPFGNLLESGTTGDTTTRFRFAGYKWDNTTGMYNCNARWYDPAICRFTGRDPVKGRFQEPMTLHTYLYCANDPINMVDRDGRWAIVLGGSFSGNYNDVVDSATSAFGFVGRIGAYNLCLMHAVEAAGVGGTFGGGVVLGYGKDDFFAGSIYWGAAGASVANSSGVSFTFDLGFSPNAQSLNDLGGRFSEYGGSATFPAPVGSPFFFGTAGFTYAMGDNGTDLYTISGGTGYTTWGVGHEGHWYEGSATVVEW